MNYQCIYKQETQMTVNGKAPDSASSEAFFYIRNGATLAYIDPFLNRNSNEIR